MARRPDLPSRTVSAPARPSRSGGNRAARSTPHVRQGAQAVDVRGWFGGVRLSVFVGIMFGLVILAVLVLLPTVGTYLEQRQRIAALEQAVQVTQDRVDELEAERAQWGDRAYVTAQARERLFYHLPGEVVYLVDNDLDPATLAPEQIQVSDQVEEAGSDWMGGLVRSVTEAGLSRTAATGGDGQ